ncbi:hypothetical protein F5878DRAFT_20115 [Lentinula raphanica]|uniref:Uncharacterized protein n=1 Tax=Lentinula raphanica TaxID=153919 RepID=A0AA38NX28_9AGAR|nr:hypothetical protein F5878DRAFT_20115 [Lentinula raphanica]
MLYHSPLAFCHHSSFHSRTIVHVLLFFISVSRAVTTPYLSNHSHSLFTFHILALHLLHSRIIVFSNLLHSRCSSLLLWVLIVSLSINTTVARLLVPYLDLLVIGN